MMRHREKKWKVWMRAGSERKVKMLIIKRIKKFSKPGFSSTWTVNFQMFKLDLEKAEEPEIKFKHLLDHQKSKSSRKTSISVLLTMPKPLTVWITKNCGKF